MRFFIKFGYIGWQYTGFQSGNGEYSIEDTIKREVVSAGIADSISSAARTDRNVSAISNVMALDSDMKPDRILGILNSRIPFMLFHSFATVPEGMNPRHCEQKSYRYIIPSRLVRDVQLLERQISTFTGKHDFSAFSRRDSRNPVRTINSVRVERAGEFIIVDFSARSFLWNQIRSIIAFCLHYNMEGDFIQDPFARTDRFPLLADPTRLLLRDIEYPGVSFTVMISRSKIRNFSSILETTEGRGMVSGEFLSEISGINSNM